jgi:protein-arginine kinase activator protein McsA
MKAIKELPINPSFIFNPSKLMKKCQSCDATLEIFLKQYTQCCGHCFINFRNEIRMYLDYIDKEVSKKKVPNKKIEEPEDKIKDLLQKQKDAISLEDWIKAAQYRDEIKKIQSKKLQAKNKAEINGNTKEQNKAKTSIPKNKGTTQTRRKK